MRGNTKSLFFGQYLLSRGIITPAKLAAATEYQKQFNSRIGDYAVALGLLTDEDVRRINAVQLSENLLFGEAALKLGLLQKRLLHELVAAQRIDHVMLGEALVALGYVTKEQVDEALADFLRVREEHMRTLFELPDDLPMRALAEKLFPLSHLLLFRAWGLQNQPGDLQIVSEQVLLSDLNALTTLTGDVNTHVLVAVPQPVAEGRERWLSAEQPATEGRQVEQLVMDMADMVCKNVAAALEKEGVKAETGKPRAAEFRVPLAPETRAAVMPYLTHEGQIFVGYVYSVE